MTCRCCYLSPFRWADFPGGSIFGADPAFAKGAITGTTMSQIASASVERITATTGRNPGSIRGMSAKGNLLIEESENARRKRSGGHNQRKGA